MLERGVREFFELVFASDDEFPKLSREYLESALAGSSASVVAGGRIGQLEVATRGAKWGEVWRLRAGTESAGGEAAFDPGKLITDLESGSKRGTREITDAAEFWLRHLVVEGRKDEARKFLTGLARTRLGEKVEWEKFVKSPDTRSPQGYYTEGKFPNPRHTSFANFMQRCGRMPSIAWFVAGYANRHRIDDNRQLTGEGIVRRGSDALELLQPQHLDVIVASAPFFEDAKYFTTLSTGGSSMMQQFFSEMKSAKLSDELVQRIRARQPQTFGTRLSLAMQAGNGRKAVADFVRDYHGEIAALGDDFMDEFSELVAEKHSDPFTAAEIGEEALAVIEKIDAERRAAALARADEFLAFKRIRDTGKENEGSFNPYVHEIIDAQLHAGDWEKAESVFWHAAGMVKPKQKAQDWYPHWNGWSYEADFIEDFHDDYKNPHLARLAFQVRLLRNDTGGRAPHSGWSNSRILKEAFTKRGGAAKLEEALAATLGDLHAMVGEGAVSILGLPFFGLIGELTPAQQKRTLDWADAHREGHEFSPLARELAMAARLYVESPYEKFPQKLAQGIAEPRAWHGHYLAVITDESLTLPWRMAVAHHVVFNARQRLDDTFLRPAMTVLVEILKSDCWFNGWNLIWVTEAFCALEKDEAWRKNGCCIHRRLGAQKSKQPQELSHRGSFRSGWRCGPRCAGRLCRLR